MNISNNKIGLKFYLFILLISIDVTGEIIKYPYIATEERKNFILSNFKKITIGMKPIDVIKIMGTPDANLKFYKHVFNSKIIGYNYWYIIRRMQKNGSVKEKDEELVRISFNLNGKVITISYWGREKSSIQTKERTLLYDYSR